MADHFPPDIDMNNPSIARMYDYLLGGKDNFAVDREACDTLLDTAPEIFTLANDNRAFLARAVDYVAAQGVDQFLDLGAGLPTASNTHHVAQRANPGARVVYVDNDPIVLAHGRALLTDIGKASFLLADMRDTESLVNGPEVRELIDTDLPVCLMLVSLLHCIPDSDEPFPLVRNVMDMLAPGSAVIYSHIVSDDPKSAEWMTQTIHAAGADWGRVRTPQEASVVFDGLEMVSPWMDGRDEDPIKVDCASWRHPDTDPVERPADPDVKLWELSGVAFKR